MCQALKKDTLECSDYGSVLGIHKVYYIKNDVEMSRVTLYLTQTTKRKCDGRLSCSIREISVCLADFSYHVEFVCEVDQTKGRFAFVLQFLRMLVSYEI